MSQYFHGYTDTGLSLVGFALFAAVFLAWLFWTGLKPNLEAYEEIAKKIFDEGELP